jgi:hypothetical protein
MAAASPPIPAPTTSARTRAAYVGAAAESSSSFRHRALLEYRLERIEPTGDDAMRPVEQRP